MKKSFGRYGRFVPSFCGVAKFLSFCLGAMVALASLHGCDKSSGYEQNGGQKLKVVASLFPQYDFARQVLQEKAEISLLLPPGTEGHNFDPSPADISKICKADLFLYTGDYMEPWAKRVCCAGDGGKVTVVNVSENIALQKGAHSHGEDHAYDPHIWLDPTLAMAMVDNISEKACEKSPENKEFFKKNAANFKDKLQQLDSDFLTVVESAKQKNIVFGGKFAHLYFTNRYGLKYKSAVHGCSGEQEPSVKRISKIINFINENQIPVVYYEELTAPKTAISIAEQTHAKLLHFSSVHNITKEQLDAGLSYIDIMKQNLQNLKEALLEPAP